MKYLCLIYTSAGNGAPLSEREQNALINEHLDYDAGLRQRGQFIHAQALQPPSTATIVRMRNGCLSMTDGPFAEAKEQVAGFLVIEARDLNDAIRIAAGIPSARHGAIEVRPVWELTRCSGV